MSAANPLIGPTTAVATATFNATECDQITICTSAGAILDAESITVSVVSTNGLRAYYFSYLNSPIAITATPTQAQLTGNSGAVILSLTLPGGPIYSFAKTPTSNLVGLDVIVKPRIGGGAS